MGQGEACYGVLRKIKDQRTGGQRRGSVIIPGNPREENVYGEIGKELQILLTGIVDKNWGKKKLLLMSLIELFQ